MFVEKPLFIIPRGEPDPAAEDVRFPTADGLALQGAYLKTPAAARKGVILFGIEYGSDRWSCRSYCDPLLAAGYDVFAYEPRNQGKSDADPRLRAAPVGDRLRGRGRAGGPGLPEGPAGRATRRGSGSSA